ncbi:MAG: FAD-binding protein [Actinomycetota bacterium]|nr:FAD-binding protein [Actinomycetota bacterium]
MRVPWSSSPQAGPAREPWSNWAGTVTCRPTSVEYPVTTADMARVVRAARRRGQQVKAIGSGHSFSPIAATDGVQVRLGRHRRVLDIDRERATVTVEAGIRLRSLANTLAARGLALTNLGDVAVQSLAGAISTGTHGTGARYGGLATQVLGLEMILADGSVVQASPEEEPELFDAARLGLGALGLISTVTLQCVPAFDLRAVEDRVDLDSVMASLDDDVGAYDHYEWYWVPHTRRVRTKANDRTDEAPRGRGRLGEWRDRMFLENVVFGALCRVERRIPALTHRLAPIVASGGRSEWIERSDRVFTSPRRVHFVEMEYALPRDRLRGVIDALVDVVDDLNIAFPVEVRFAAADDVPLSTAYGRESAYVAVHQYRGMAYRAWFEAAEAIFTEAGGRPHWGKMHTRDAAGLAPLYPRWEAFAAVRRRVDPGGLWSNAYLDRVLGPVG